MVLEAKEKAAVGVEQSAAPAGTQLRSRAPQEVSPVEVAAITKSFLGEVQAVKGVSFSVHEGEVFTLLGPSGCGKSTTLRLIAGLEDPDAGVIRIRGREVAAPAKRLFVQPDKRDIGMVFQSYALWPHMTVEENVAYPLKVRRMPRGKIQQRVDEVLEIVGLAGMQKRTAPALSGGQQQRVALARALAPEPTLLMLDEPFSNLDAKLRDQMRLEMKLLQKRLKLTVIFVTHDQVEALSLSSRVALMNQGVIQQIGSPQEVFERPSNEFVRDFIGRVILLRATVRAENRLGQIAVAVDGSDYCVVFARTYHGPFEAGQAVYLCIRPDDLEVLPAEGSTSSPETIRATIEASLFTGGRTEYRVSIPGQDSILAYGPRRHLVADGQAAILRIQPDGHTIWPIRAS